VWTWTQIGARLGTWTLSCRHTETAQWEAHSRWVTSVRTLCLKESCFVGACQDAHALLADIACCPASTISASGATSGHAQVSGGATRATEGLISYRKIERSSQHLPAWFASTKRTWFTTVPLGAHTQAKGLLDILTAVFILENDVDLPSSVVNKPLNGTQSTVRNHNRRTPCHGIDHRLQHCGWFAPSNANVHSSRIRISPATPVHSQFAAAALSARNLRRILAHGCRTLR